MYPLRHTCKPVRKVELVDLHRADFSMCLASACRAERGGKRKALRDAPGLDDGEGWDGGTMCNLSILNH